MKMSRRHLELREAINKALKKVMFYCHDRAQYQSTYCHIQCYYKISTHHYQWQSWVLTIFFFLQSCPGHHIRTVLESYFKYLTQYDATCKWTCTTNSKTQVQSLYCNLRKSTSLIVAYLWHYFWWDNFTLGRTTTWKCLTFNTGSY